MNRNTTLSIVSIVQFAPRRAVNRIHGGRGGGVYVYMHASVSVFSLPFHVNTSILTNNKNFLLRITLYCLNTSKMFMVSINCKVIFACTLCTALWHETINKILIFLPAFYILSIVKTLYSLFLSKLTCIVVDLVCRMMYARKKCCC